MRRHGTTTTTGRTQPVTDAVLLAPLGSNPAHLISLAWALYVDGGVRVRSARIVLFARGLRYFERELRGPRGALAQLHAALGRSVLPHAKLHVHPLQRDGRALDDDARTDDARAFYDAVLEQARSAIAEAGSLPVIFALVGGSRRTLTVATTVVAQYLARPQDRLIDVRYTPKHAADLAGRFFFPAQKDQTPLRIGAARTVRPKDVAVAIVDVPIPRIGGLVQLGEHTNYRAMLEAGQASIDAASAPQLVLDLSRERPLATLAWASGRSETLRLGPAKLLTLAALALAQERGQPWLRAARAVDDRDTHPFVQLVATCKWAAHIDHEAIKAFRAGPVPRHARTRVDASITKLRSDTVEAVRALCRRLAIPESALVPERERRLLEGKPGWVQRLPCRARVLWP